MSWSINSNGLGFGINGYPGAGLAWLDGGDSGYFPVPISGATNGWVHEQFDQVVTTGTHSLVFEFYADNNSFAAGLDDVVVTAETPEPGESLRWLVVAGMVGLFAARRKMSQAL